MTKKIKLALLTQDTDLTTLAKGLGCSVPFLSMLLAGKRSSKRIFSGVAQRLHMPERALQEEIQKKQEKEASVS